MSLIYPIETLIEYEARYSYKGKPQLWLNVTVENDLPDLPLSLSFSGNTDVNKTLHTYQVRPDTGHYVATNQVTEDRGASINAVPCGCGDVPKGWRIKDERLSIETEVAYSNNPLIDLLFNYGTKSNKDSKIRAFGGIQEKQPIRICLIYPDIVSYLPNLYKCEVIKGIIAPAKKTYSNKSYTTMPMKFLAQELLKLNGSHYPVGSMSILEWYVQVSQTQNTLLSAQEVFDLIAAG